MKKLDLLIITFLLLFASSSFSYEFTEDFTRGFYWASLPVKIKVQESDYSEKQRLESFLELSFEAWEDATSREIWEVEYSDDTQNVIRWTDDLYGETGYPESSTLAVTIRYNYGTYISRVEIVLNKNFPGLTENTGNRLYQTILHEVGHTVGLGHTSEGAIMNPIIGSYNMLYSDDIEGMIAVIDKTIERQTTGYVSPEAATTTGGCTPAGFSDGGSIKSSNSFLASLLAGLLIIVLPFWAISRKLLPNK